MNFFTPYISRERVSKNRIIIAAGICSFLLILIGSFYAGTELISAYLNRDIKAMNTFVNSRENVDKLNKINAKKKMIEIMNKYSGAVDEISTNLEAHNKINSTVIETMNTTIPKDISFSTLALAQDTFQIQGSAPGWKSVAELEHNLNALEIFQKVQVGTIQARDDMTGRVTFNIQCTLKDVIKK